MKLNATILYSCVDDEKEEASTPPSESSPPAPASIVVGYAFTSKKKKSFLKPKFIRFARNKGIQFVPIDLKRALSEQGPFNIVLHKLEGRDWSQVIERLHPEVTVVDPPEAIQHLRNRQSMLEVVADLKFPESYGKVCTPRQLVISKNPTSVPDEVVKAGLSVPLVVKPLVVDGSVKSHALFLAYDHISLSELEAPMVLQEFINHSGVLFKVFIVGESIKVVRRFSLPDLTETDISTNSGVFGFPRVSGADSSADDVDLDPAVAELPPQPMLEMLAKELHHRLGLRLFNLDIIRQKGTKDLYYIIDINYFPGYGKMPDYEQIFTDFLVSLVQS
ncbi:inositol-tetrakisphosphate 1-kinase 3-like isoform X2 [Salvia splendens]|uniref:inositol-tetrakisphosphate 1-kinase 3-like isoform X2 n=1 Tax=Salvia splendens TaxID=180675 RepID=UPI001C269867|nr:inositol-tetrakisphosphate 1-kinase 3-like isoform X2 [Salvia splendens]XP_042043053.1 inositol-tetrakisphosphate 1-kinase 3-like isoform X2 [Salvia splendens]